MPGTPVVLLAFANDQGRYLESLQRESDAIVDALRGKKDAGCLDLEVQQGATLERLFTLLDRYGDDLVAFHYGGHANGSALDLEAAGGGNAVAHGHGLAGLLGSLKNLQLVVLNGCATQGHVEALLKAGVPAVIATSAPVEDEIALGFANQFYAAFGDISASRTIEFAFDRAKSFVETARGSAIAIGTNRGMTVGEGEPPAVGLEKWGLYAARGKEAVFAWTLPDKPAGLVMMQAASPQATGASLATPNSRLIADLANAIGGIDGDFAELMAFQRKRSHDGSLDERIVRDEVANAFPSPIGAKLLKLFSGGQLGEPRLALLVNTYDITMRFLALATVAQLWDLFEARRGAVNLTEDQWQQLEAFNALDESGALGFDYLALAIALVEALQANGGMPLMVECAGLGATFADPRHAEAQAFMNRARQEWGGQTLDPAAVEAATAEAERHLDAALTATVFVVGYTLAVIKQIKVIKPRNREALYVHQRVVLDRASSSPSFPDPTKELAHFAANDAVILLKEIDDVSSYVNLSPFVIDTNALTGNPGSRLYFLRSYDAQADTLHYVHVSEERDRLAIGPAMPEDLKATHLPILQLYKEFRAEVARR